MRRPVRYAVTGGMGFIGSRIVLDLLGRGHDVAVVDSLHKGRAASLDGMEGRFEFARADILDGPALRDALRGADGVFHQAALTSVPESFAEPERYRRVNVEGTRRVLEAAGDAGAKVVYASTSSVYGNVASKGPVKEGAAKRPANPYGETKLECEGLAAGLHREAGLRVIGLRYFNVYGAGQTGGYAGVVTRFLGRLAAGRPPVVAGDGSQARDFVHVDDVAAANRMAMESGADHAFLNVGTGVPTTVSELARAMIRLSGMRADPEFAELPEGDVAWSQADTSLASSAIGWSYSTGLEEGLAALVPRRGAGI